MVEGVAGEGEREGGEAAEDNTDQGCLSKYNTGIQPVPITTTIRMSVYKCSLAKLSKKYIITTKTIYGFSFLEIIHFD